MTDIGKFFSDVDKLKKHIRQNNSGKCDYDAVKKDLRSLFERAANKISPASRAHGYLYQIRRESLQV